MEKIPRLGDSVVSTGKGRYLKGYLGTVVVCHPPTVQHLRNVKFFSYCFDIQYRSKCGKYTWVSHYEKQHKDFEVQQKGTSK